MYSIEFCQAHSCVAYMITWRLHTSCAPAPLKTNSPLYSPLPANNNKLHKCLWHIHNLPMQVKYLTTLLLLSSCTLTHTYILLHHERIFGPHA